MSTDRHHIRALEARVVAIERALSNLDDCIRREDGALVIRNPDGAVVIEAAGEVRIEALEPVSISVNGEPVFPRGE
jgi:hypothetical protein